MDVSVIIVSWNVREELMGCLTSIYRETHNISFEIFVVDNDSRDNSASMVREKFPSVNLIANSKNFGFARACNQAIRKSSGHYILLLNPDTEITDHAIERTVAFMNRLPLVGIAGCRLVNADGSVQPSVRRFPDFSSHLLIMLKLHNFFKENKKIQRYYVSDFDYNRSSAVEQVMGAFFMIKRPLLKQIGLLDEHFFIWYEEVDLCQRALKAGWPTYYCAEATVLHHKAKSFSQRSAIRKQVIFCRSLLYYFFKHRSIAEYVGLLCLYPVSLGLAIVVQILSITKKRNDL